MLKNGVLLIPHHFVHQKHIIQLLLIMILMVFEEKDEKNDFFVIVMAKLFEVVLEKHKIYQNWMKCEIGYNVHAIMHVQQVRLVIFEKIRNWCDYLMLLILQENKMVQSIHWIRQ